MATVNSTRAKRITVHHLSWGLWVSGARELLIQQGYAQSVPFPGDPGVKKTVCDSLDQQGRAIKIWYSSKTTFRIIRRWTDEEQAWYDKLAAKKEDTERATRMQEEEIQRAKKLVNSWPKTEEDYREKEAEYADISLKVLEAEILDGNNGGWRYDDATTHKIERLIDELYELIKTGGAVEDMALKEQNTPACIADVVLASQSKLTEPRYKVEGNIIRLARCHILTSERAGKVV